MSRLLEVILHLVVIFELACVLAMFVGLMLIIGISV